MSRRRAGGVAVLVGELVDRQLAAVVEPVGHAHVRVQNGVRGEARRACGEDILGRAALDESRGMNRNGSPVAGSAKLVRGQRRVQVLADDRWSDRPVLGADAPLTRAVIDDETWSADRIATSTPEPMGPHAAAVLPLRAERPRRRYRPAADRTPGLRSTHSRRPPHRPDQRPSSALDLVALNSAEADASAHAWRHDRMLVGCAATAR